jgi:hypothetical protein
MILMAVVTVNGDRDRDRGSGSSNNGNNGNGDNGEGSSENGADWEVEQIKGTDGVTPKSGFGYVTCNNQYIVIKQ